MSTNGELSNVKLAILGILRDSRDGLHGRAIAAAARKKSDGHFRMPCGTLYPGLQRLEESGLITAQWEDFDVAAHAGRPQRHTYRITNAGRAALIANVRFHEIRAKFLGLS